MVVDKPGGLTSHDVVARLRRYFGTRKVGHAGTLDPMATGVLVVGIERATKILGLLALETKSYQATIRLGESSTTDDAEGETTARRDASGVTDEAIDAAVADLTGEISQVPSAVSAIKVDGRRAYDRVRAGEQVELAPRQVTVSRFEILERRRSGEVVDLVVVVDCSTGTYIRALARDLGAALGVGGHLTALRRTCVGPFGLEVARTLEELESAPRLSLDLDAAALAAFPRREISSDEAEGLRHGRWLDARGDDGVVAAVAPDGRVAALVSEAGRRAAPVVVMRPAGLPEPGRKVDPVQLWRTFDEIVTPDGGTSVALGVFDGLHRGHRGLVDHAVRTGRELGASPVLVTFDPHPVEVVRPGTHPLVLTPLERRAELAGEFGVQAVFALPFDAEMASWEPDEFIDRVLVRGLRARAVAVGSNFTFGRRAAGTSETMRALCAERGIAVTVMELLESGGDTVSSTRIRRLLADSDVAGAAAILGRPHRVSGVVVHGAGRGGRDLGYPTANLELPDYTAVPEDGVYAGWFTLLDDHAVNGSIVPGRRYPTAISVGTNPTFGDTARSVEAFVLDESADLYGRVAAVDFVDHVRDMEKFTSVDELLAAMGHDVARTRTVLGVDGAPA